MDTLRIMKTGYVYDDVYLKHDTGPTHPEQADRLRIVMGSLQAEGLLRDMQAIKPRKAEPAQLQWLHDAGYVAKVKAACEAGKSQLDTPDTPICRDSYEAALWAVGGMFAACDAVMKGEVGNAFCAMRPPGHHAERKMGMGFCLFNNIALGAEYLIREHGLKRVAIVDFDVHHGNGTQHMFEERSDVLLIDLHEHPRFLFPGTGYEHENGVGAGIGYTINLPMFPGTGDEAYEEAFEKTVVPALEKYQPEIILVSTGFDVLAEDPLAHLELTDGGVVMMTQRLVDAAGRLCGGKLISVLEGGYEFEALSRCSVKHVGVLMAANREGSVSAA